MTYFKTMLKHRQVGDDYIMYFLFVHRNVDLDIYSDIINL